MTAEQAFCTECGTALHGAKFCPECGTLTANASPPQAASPNGHGGVATAPAPVLTAPLEALRPPEPPRSHRPLIIALGAALIAVLAAIAVVALGGGEKKQAAAVRPTATATVAATATAPAETPAPTATALAAVTEGAAKTLAYEYAGAYSAESVKLLASLLAPDFQRNNGGDQPQNRTQALAAYATQFKGLSKPHYDISDVEVTTTHDTATVTGSYTIASGGGEATGSIMIDMARVDGKLLITRIIAMPDTTGSSSGGSSSSSGGSSSSSSGSSGGSSSSSGGDSSSSSGGGTGGLLWYGNQLPPSYVPDLY